MSISGLEPNQAIGNQAKEKYLEFFRLSYMMRAKAIKLVIIERRKVSAQYPYVHLPVEILKHG